MDGLPCSEAEVLNCVFIINIFLIIRYLTTASRGDAVLIIIYGVDK